MTTKKWLLAVTLLSLGICGMTMSAGESSTGKRKKYDHTLLNPEWEVAFQGERKRVTASDGAIDLQTLFSRQPERARAVLVNSFKAPSAGVLRLGMAANWWMEARINNATQPVLTTMWSGNRGPVSPATRFADIPVKAGENTLTVTVDAGRNGWAFVYGKPAPTLIPAEEEECWVKTVPLNNKIVAGSALDLTQTSEERVKEQGRIIYNPQAGAYVYENFPSKAVRIFGTESIPQAISTPWWTFKEEKVWKTDIDDWAASLRRMGYASIRMHTLDKRFTGWGNDDMRADPAIIDRFHYAVSRMKAEGLRLQLSILAYDLYNGKANGSKAMRNRSEHRAAFLFLNEYECDRFKFGVETLLEKVNPYTSLRLADDPMLISVELYNEQETGTDQLAAFYHNNRVPEFAPVRVKIEEGWKAFLKKRGLAGRPVPKPREDTPDQALFLHFLADQLDVCYHWGEKILRDTGYQGLIIQNSESKRVVNGVTRWRCAQAIEAHGYYSHPSAQNQSGSKISQESAIYGLGEQFRSINSTRLLGRAFQVGEFNSPFWNRFAHEGFLYPAYAALQEHQIISHFANPYTLVKNSGTGSFTIADNPTMMANGFLGAVLFGRGDLQGTRNFGALEIPAAYLDKGANMFYPINTEQSKIALLVGLGITFPDCKPAPGAEKTGPRPAFTVTAAERGGINDNDWASNLVDNASRSFDLTKFIRELKAKKLLPEENMSDPAKGIFQSDTGEITLYGPARMMTVITPKTEVISWMGDQPQNLNEFKVKKSTTHATAAVSAVDGKTLKEASRIVLIYNTETINTGMEVSPDWTTLWKLGSPPVLMRTGMLSAELNVKPGNWELHALGVDGDRLEQLPLRQEDGKLFIDLDTAKLSKGTTPFFELIRTNTTPELEPAYVPGNKTDTTPELEPVYVPGSKPGLPLSAAGDHLFHIGGGQLEIYDIKSNPETPRLISTLPGMSFGDMRQMVYLKGYLYLSARATGVWIIDVRDVNTPRLIGNLNTVELASGIDAAGNLLFVSQRDFGVEVFDVTDPVKPRQLSLTRTVEAQSCFAMGDRLAVGDWRAGEALLFDIGNPAKLQLLSKSRLDGFGDGVYLEGNILYAATGHHARKGSPEAAKGPALNIDWEQIANPVDPALFGRGHGVEIFDIADPRKPKKLGGVKFPPYYSLGNDFWYVTRAGRYLAVADTGNGVFLVDDTDKKAPRIAAHITLPEVDRTQKPDVAGSVVSGRGVLYIAGLNTGLFTVKMPGVEPSPERKPPTVKSMVRPVKQVPGFRRYDCGGMVRSAKAHKGFLYAAASDAGLQIYKNTPRGLERIDTIEQTVFDVALSGDLAVTVGPHGELTSRRILPNGKLQRLGTVKLPQALYSIQLYCNGKIAAGHNGGNSSHFYIDLAKPETPKVIEQFNERRILYANPFPMQEIDGKIITANNVGGLSCMNLSGGKVTRQQMPQPRINQLSGITNLGKYFVAPYYNTYVLIDPEKFGAKECASIVKLPVKLFGFPMWDGKNTLAVSDRHGGGVAVLDVTDPVAPTLKNRYDFMPEVPMRATFLDGNLIIPAGYGGLYVRE